MKRTSLGNLTANLIIESGFHLWKYWGWEVSYPQPHFLLWPRSLQNLLPRSPALWECGQHMTQINRIAVIDIKGFLGATVNLSQRTGLLLKVLAISDLVIY